MKIRIFKTIKKYHKTLLITLLVSFLSLANFDDFETPSKFLFHGADKLIHFIMYFTLSLIFMLEWYHHSPTKPNRQKVIFINVLPLLLSISFEIIQEYCTTSRNGSLYDEIFNIIGITAAIFAFHIVKKWCWVRTLVIFPFKV